MAERVVGPGIDGELDEKRVSIYSKSDKNRDRGYRIWFLVRVMGWTQVSAWREVVPESKSADKTAQMQCSRFLKWYEETFPPTFDQAANAFGLHAYRLMGKINEWLDRKKWAWDEKAGCRVETNEPDDRTQLAGFRELLKLIGKSELWRRQFLEQDQANSSNLILPPKFETVQEYEEWMRKEDPLKRIEEERKAATAARDARLAEEGRKPMPPRPPVNGSHQ